MEVLIKTIDEEFEKSQVKGFVRTKKGKLERVNPFSRKGNSLQEDLDAHRKNVREKNLADSEALLDKFKSDFAGKYGSAMDLWMGDDQVKKLKRMVDSGKYKFKSVNGELSETDEGPSLSDIIDKKQKELVGKYLMTMKIWINMTFCYIKRNRRNKT